ncbi:hypothetical protein [Blastococcus mobilis]|uniref:Uncharacterized protein n=1 Tax=Blastococcus mobilis TaxID=1938746 RepID=A0A238ZT45_9ACTN|nr:hypothetical protein [Blastococcus mobilis]SNR86171.1 hypothetical protein SAMN06272737_13231 [Blastococcus mobilis]
MSRSEQVWDDAIRIGRENQQTLELARRHCLNMQFVESGGRGMAEEATGLPINMRQVRCPVAFGSKSMNLFGIAGTFYEEHCVGCSLRRPTGEVPNLATVMEERAAEDARQVALRDAEIERARQRWAARTERRRAIAASGGEAMADAVANIGLLDAEPGSVLDRAEQSAAQERLAALADRAPQVFTDEVVALAVELVADVGVAPELLEPLRRLAGRRRQFAEPVLRAALAALSRGPVTSAGRCVADFPELLSPAALDEQVCRSLVLLAGAPRRDSIGRSRPSQTADPTGLRAATGIAPGVVTAVLRRLLPPPARPRSLIVPTPEPPRPVVTDFERAAAGAAIATLIPTHPQVAEQMIPTLILDLGVPADDRFDDPALPAVARALAVMLVLGVGDVVAAAEDAGRTGSPESREALLRVFHRAADLLDPDGPRRQPGDPVPDGERRMKVMASVLTAALARVSGDWGDDLRDQAARLIEQQARLDPRWMLTNLPALLGAVLKLMDDLTTPPPRTLEVISAEPPQLRVLEQLNRETAISSAARDVLDAVEAAAAADPLTAVTVITTLITEERDSARGPEVVWRLLRPLGRIGRRHGDQPGVLQAILPTLYSYLVDTDASLRARAIDQWVEIGSAHQLPSSLPDLLPALTADPYDLVIHAVLRAARRLDWPEPARAQLLLYVVLVLEGVDAAKHPDGIKEAIGAALRLARGDEALLTAVEGRAVQRAAALDGHDLRDALQRDWLPATSRSPRMAELRLRQAADPAINDRLNAGDDDELCALLDCGAGLAELPTADLIRAALGEAPQYPLISAEFAEVAWRAARPADAATVMRAVADTIPGQPAFAWQQRFTQLMIAAAAADAAAMAGQDWRPDAARAAAAAAELDDEDHDSIRALLAAVTSALEVRRLLSGDPASARDAPGGVVGAGGDAPVAECRARAQALKRAGEALAAAAPPATATGAYLRGIAGLCQVATHLLLGDAAVLDADTAAITAHTTAAQRRAQIVVAELADRFDRSDPVAGPLITRLEAVAELEPGAPMLPVLAVWARLPIPVPVVRGPRRSVRADHPTPHRDTDDDRRPIAVLLASIDGRLVTGPEVLTPHTVHELTLQVQADPWPDWAERLDAELLTHLTQEDITTPGFSWHRDEHTGDGDTYLQSGPLVLRFGLPAGRSAPPFLIRLTWRGKHDGQPRSQSLDVTGHRELRLRPFDATRDMLTDYAVFDERLLDLYERLARSGYDQDQLQAFCRLLTAICRIGLRMTWDKEYRRGARVSERKFHDDLYDRLLAEPELEDRLERGSPLALGFLDVRHDGITAELKVERKTPVTQDSAPKYIGQPTQYAAADGARLSILTILDMSPKVLPIGTPENYLFTMGPQLHGLENPEAPSLVATLIVNGNMPTPSSWSRRRTPTEGDGL